MKPIVSSRRRFLAGASSFGAAWLSGMPAIAKADPGPEITKLRIAQGPFICYAPQLLAELTNTPLTGVGARYENPTQTVLAQTWHPSATGPMVAAPGPTAPGPTGARPARRRTALLPVVLTLAFLLAAGGTALGLALVGKSL